MLRRQIATATLLGLILALASALTALAKGDAIVTLDSSLPSHPDPGSEVTIGWTVEVPVENGQMAPFNAEGMFIRLISATGDSVEAVGRQSPLGHYAATLAVPVGGISDVEVGLRGESCIAGICERSDMLFAIDETTIPAIAPVAEVAPVASVAAAGPASLEDPAGATAPVHGSSDTGSLGLAGVGLAAVALVLGLTVLLTRSRRLTPG